MLNELVVEGLGVIERAELNLECGCSALTGETGAGKTLVVAALGLLAGGRSVRALVREGAAEARVEGRFVVPGGHRSVDVLRRHGIVEDDPVEPGPEVEIIMTRTVTADGKGGRARINGRLTTIAALAEVGELLVEIAGQHEAQGIGAPARQRALLDSFAGLGCVERAGELARAVRASGRARRELDERLSSEREREREADLLRYESAEIESADLHVGEAEVLTAEAERLEYAESIALALERAGEALRSEGGAAEILAAAHADVAGAARRDATLADLAERLETMSLEAADVAGDLGLRMVAPDPGALETTRARLDVISRLARKYGDRRAVTDDGPEAEVLAHLARCRARLAELEGAESSLAELRRTHEETLARAKVLALELSDLRREAAPRLEAAMEELLTDLALPGARFEVALVEHELSEGGAESVEFRVSANPGEAPRLVAQVASGGELARIALALHLLTATESSERGRGRPPAAQRTMIFDEVDAGVGGRAAQAVGRALAQLARTPGAQVLLVTHLPQVAACADYHFRVEKGAAGGRNAAVVSRISGTDRVDELSRMLAGMPESERAREHARELLETASAT